AIILKLLAKNPANRYPKAEDLRADLQRYLAGAHRIPTRTGQSPPVRTSERPATGSQVPPAPVAGRPRTGPVATAPPPSGGPPTGPRAQVPAAPGPGPGPPPQYVPPAYYYEEVHRSDGWKRTVLMFFGLVVLVAALGFLGWIFYDSLGLGDNNGPTEPTTPDGAALIEVPDVSGLSYGEADALLRSAGLEPEPSYQVNTGVPENTVFAQSPPGGQRIEEGATVALTVSQGEIPRVPPVRGRNRVDATEILRSAGYEVIVIEGTSQAEAGIVVGQEPSSNTELALGEAVTITVSTGPGQIFVPDVRGQTLIQAIQTLADQGFRVAERREPSATVPEGEIIETDPLHGFPVAVGLEIYIIVSDGPPLVAIPDVQGLLFDTGKLTIERDGLVVGIVTFEPVEPGSSDVGRILAQTPPPNLEVSAGTEVDVVVGESSETEGDQIGPEQPEGEGGETEGIDQAG
ncbi:MAG: PASTA domain-containing protein, partial [Acidimicrobiaceae bacterium]|nr:PASTA domain-containing protein [Acidimicrobiaceae bacterium]